MMDKEKLANIYKERLDEKIIGELSARLGLPLRKAMDCYYRSHLSQQIQEGRYGIENMDYRYLAQDLIENEAELFGE